MPNAVTPLQARRAQWEAFARWQAAEDPVRRMAPADSLRWAGELQAWYVGRFGRHLAEPQPADYAGVALMRRRLAGLTPRR